jgi:hypothetical protein
MGNFFSDFWIVLISTWYWYFICFLLLVILWLPHILMEKNEIRGVLRSYKLMLLPLILGVLVFTFFMANQFVGRSRVSDLAQDFEAIALHDYSAQELSNQTHTLPVGSKWQNVDEIIIERNHRLAEKGLCAYGPWRIEQDTGEPPAVRTNSLYYWCGLYSVGSKH